MYVFAMQRGSAATTNCVSAATIYRLASIVANAFYCAQCISGGQHRPIFLIFFPHTRQTLIAAEK